MKMKILWIGGSHGRHLYYINRISEEFEISGAIIEGRENIVPNVPDNLCEIDKQNFIRHFRNRELAEGRYFGKQNLPDIPTLKIDKKELNSEKCLEFLKSIEPNVVLLFGCGLIKEPMYSTLPEHTINLHLGLSPEYRGSAGLFWAFYFMEPNNAGSTFHYIIEEPDAGDIIHQTIPKLEKSDGIHDVQCKVVLESSEDMIRLLKILEENGIWRRYKQLRTGKLFTGGEFKPEHLRVNYNVFNDDMVKQYLDGELKSRELKLIRQV